MVPSKPKKDESRRSSILKACKPRQPLQNVNFNPSSNENSPATSKIKRRVSFAEKKHVKEFCHSTEQGTVWDNTYEEHDSILKGSFATDQNTKVDSKESASKVPSENDHIDIDIETGLNHTSDSDLTHSQQYSTSATEVHENDKDDLNFTNPVEHVEIFSQELPLGKTISPNVPESTSDNAVTIYTNKDKENCASSIYNEYYPKMCVSNVNSELDRTCVQDMSMEFTMIMPASSIPVYCDAEDKQENVQKDNVPQHQDDFDTNCTMEITKVVSWKNKAETFVPTSKQENLYDRNDINSSFTEKTKLLLKSMDITESVSVPLCQQKMYNIKHATKSLVSNCNNESLEITQAVPISVEPIKSDIEAFRKVPVIVQNYEDVKCNASNNSMKLLTNLQSTENIISSQIHDANYSNSYLVPENSIKLTSVVRSHVADSDTFNMNNGGNDGNFNISMEMTTALSKIDEKSTIPSCNKIVTKEDNLRKSWENTEHPNKTEFFKDVPMEITRPVNLYERNIPHPSSEDTVAGKNLRKYQETNENSGGTEFFSDTTMQMTRPINVMLPTSIQDKKNLRIDEPMLKEYRNTFLYNTSMDMTKIQSRNKEEMFNPIIHEENECERKNTNNSMTFSQRTKLLCTSMDITEAVPNSLLREKTCNTENTAEITETVVSHTVTTPKTHLPREDFAGSSFQTDPIVNNNKVINVSMKVDTVTIQSTVHHMGDITLNEMENLGISKNDESQRPTVNNIIEFKKSKTKENVTIPRETMETTNLYNTSSNTSALTNNFDHSSSAALNMHYMEDIIQNEMENLGASKNNKSQRPTVNNVIGFSKNENVTIPRETVETTNLHNASISTNVLINNSDDSLSAALSMHHIENITLNEMENLDASKNNEFQHPTVNNIVEFRKSEIGENVTIPRETVKTTNLHFISTNTNVLTNNSDHSSALINTSRKRLSYENENTSTKKFRSDSFVEFQPSVYDNTHLSSKTDDKYVSNKYLTKDLTRISTLSCGSNGSDSLNKIEECSFLRKNLENSFMELQSINPPSFVYMSSEEEISFAEFLRENKLHTSITTDAVPINNKNNSSERLEPVNIEHHETEDCHKSVVTNTIVNNRETDCQAIETTITDDHRVDELNRYVIDVEHLDGKNLLSTNNVDRRKTMILSSTNHFTKTNVTTKEDQIDKKEHTREEINDEIKLRNIEQKEQRSEIGKEEERCIDSLKETESAVEEQVNQDEYCQENSDGKVNPQDVEKKEDCVEERLDAEQDVNKIEKEESSVEQNPFLSLSQKLEAYAEKKDCIWSVYYKNVDRRMIGFGFMSNSLLVVTFLSDGLNHSEENLIKEVKIISRLADDVDVLMRIVHGLILEKINVETLTHSYKTHEDVLPMLDFVSQDVKLAMNFMFDLKRLDNLNLMEIARDKISFVSRSKHMDIILKITINVKRFDKLTPSDVNIRCLLGTIRETDVKNLIKNVKKNHKFLSRYMNDVRDYIDIMEEISMTRN
ncbi:uncharacterized protein LOC116853850 [Odontomachus brunneus]|uniref:uncharacterized protein LOC116853850 n=1 Tax=Odontomachus brunneus TaxID=486640 RepID=UPI0013F248F0|nr:uncharacterized protein LOC116853850 [Odontomachus brunneus]